MVSDFGHILLLFEPSFYPKFLPIAAYLADRQSLLCKTPWQAEENFFVEQIESNTGNLNCLNQILIRIREKIYGSGSRGLKLFGSGSGYETLYITTLINRKRQYR
jgi:hypothetical protein